MPMFRKTLLFALCGLLAISSVASAQTVLLRARLGNATEDITYIDRGPKASHVAIIDGYQVLALPSNAKNANQANVKTLFDTRGLGLVRGARGIAYVGSEKLFLLVDPAQPTLMFAADHKGRDHGTRTIQYPAGPAVVGLEGLAAVPAGASQYAGNLMLVAFFDDGTTRVEVIEPSGAWIAEILLPAPLDIEYLTGIGVLEPDLIVLGDLAGNYWTVSFDGTLVGAATPVAGAADLEGIVQLPDGRVMMADYAAGSLFAFSEGLSRTPAKDRPFAVGFGASRPRGLGWDSSRNELLVTAGYERDLIAIAGDLSGSSTVADLGTEGGLFLGTAYVAGEDRIAVSRVIAPSAFRIFNSDGSFFEDVDVGVIGRPDYLDFIPTTGRFAASFTGGADLFTLYITARDGSLVDQIDFSGAGVGIVRSVAFFNPGHPSGGQFLVRGSSGTVLVTDLSGTVLDSFSALDDLGMLVPAGMTAITSGPWAGGFAAVDFDGAEVVIFTLD